MNSYTIPAEEFIDQLSAVFPRWQKQFDSLAAAARAACMELDYDVFMQSPAGKARAAALAGVPDYLAAQRAQQAELERFIAAIGEDSSPYSGDDENPSYIESCEPTDWVDGVNEGEYDAE